MNFLQENSTQLEREQFFLLESVKIEQIETPEDCEFLWMFHNIVFHKKIIKVCIFSNNSLFSGLDLCGYSHKNLKQELFSECTAEGSVSRNLVLLN